MIKLVTVKNPFQPWQNRKIQDLPYGFTAKELVNLAGFNNVEVNCSVDGKSVETIDTYIIPDNTIMVVSPVVGKGGKSIIGLVAAVALSVAVAGMGAAISTQAWAGATMTATGAMAATTTSMLVASLVSAAVMFVGSTLIGRFMGTSSKSSTSSQDATYSWSGVSTTEGQDNPIVMTYGKVKTGGQTIGKFAEIIDNKEYLNWLVSAGEGPVEITNITLNDNDIGNYSEVDVEIREGTNDQEVISNFNDTYFTKSLGYQLLDDEERIDTAQGSATEGLRVKIEFSNGLFHAKDNGNLENAWVQIGGWYRKQGETNWKSFIGDPLAVGGWPDGWSIAKSDADLGTYSYAVSGNTGTLTCPDGTVVTKDISYSWATSTVEIGPFEVSRSVIDEDQTITLTEGEGAKISAKSSSAVRKEFRIDNIPAGTYEVKLKVLDRQYEVTNTKASTRCWWSSLTSVVYDDFCYPCIGLLGIKALATDQISGSPTLTFYKERRYVWVYNPTTEEYEQKRADNPAWASYDMLHLANRLKNINTNQYEFEVRGVPANHIIYEHFSEWADFCDEKNLSVNLEVTQAAEMLDCINSNLANCGRGTVIRFGTRYGCIWECAKQPVQMFGMGNIISGTFQEEFLQVSDRANCVEVTYTDAEQDYTRSTVMIYGDNYDNDAEEKTAQATYNGITTYEQAYREGKYQMYCNQYQLRTVSFEANIDAIACTVGDVILVSHDVPKWANSGRIEAVDSSTHTLTLPIELDSVDKPYRVMYRTKNDILYTSSVTIISNGSGQCIVQLIDSWDETDPPCVHDVFDIALQNVGSKPFIVKSITRSQDFTRRITCIEYNENIYNENYDIPAIQYTVDSSLIAKDVTGLNANQIAYKNDNGELLSKMYVSWIAPDNGGRYTVLLSTDNEKWQILQSNIYDTSLEADVVYGQEYYVKVITTLGISKSAGASIGPISVGEDMLPPDVTAIDSEVLQDGTRRYYWDFVYPTPNDIAGFKMRYIQGTQADWQNGYDVNDGLITVQPYETTTVRQGPHVVMIKAVDNSGQESQNYAMCVVDFGIPLEDNVLYKIELSANHWSEEGVTVTTNGVVRADGNIHGQQNTVFWQSKKNLHWKSASSTYWQASYDEFFLEMQFDAPADGYFWLNYEIEGVYDLTYAISNKDNIYKPYNTKVLVEAGDTIKVKFTSPAGETETVLKSLTAVVDVPDEEQRFQNIAISSAGTELPIKIDNYYTTAVMVNSASVVGGSGLYDLEIMSREPCVVRLKNIVINGSEVQKQAVDCTADITWQGFKNKLRS